MTDYPVIIIGAGISGLLLAQHLKKHNIPFRILERDHGFATRGVGWGLTIHWSLDSMKSLLPEELVAKLPSAYVDRISLEKGVSTRAPYFDLATGNTVATTPTKPQKIRMTRQRLRLLLGTGINVEWGKLFKAYREEQDQVIVTFDDGTEAVGRLLVGADGARSRARRVVHPDQASCYTIPIRQMGFKMVCTPDECAAIRDLDPFFFSAISSENNSFLYYSILDAPGNNEESTNNYTIQASMSWPFKPGFLGQDEPLEFPKTNEERHQLLQEIASTWADPFKSFVRLLPPDAEIQAVEVQDFIPPLQFRARGRVTLIGDSVHAMAQYRGEGANHAIYDVFEFSEMVTPRLTQNSLPALRGALDQFEDIIARRGRPAVMASRRACLDAHDWTRVDTKKSPLFSVRAPWIEFDEKEMD